MTTYCFGSDRVTKSYKWSALCSGDAGYVTWHSLSSHMRLTPPPCLLLLSRTRGEEIGGGGRVTGLYTKYHTYIKGVINNALKNHIEFGEGEIVIQRGGGRMQLILGVEQQNSRHTISISPPFGFFPYKFS